jgi:Fe2+ or Zn2+ uptake regulation protein
MRKRKAGIRMKFQVTCDNCKKIIEFDHAALERLIEQKAEVIICETCRQKRDAAFICKMREKY